MKGKLLILLLSALMPALLFAAKKHPHTKYKYEYRLHLTDFPSTYSLFRKDSTLGGKSFLNFSISDKFGSSSFAVIKLHCNNVDTFWQCDIDGLVSATIRSDTFNIEISAIGLTVLKIEKLILKPNTLYEIQTLLGQHKSQHIVVIHSLRKLTTPELDILIENLSNERDDNILFTKKICYYDWEI